MEALWADSSLFRKLTLPDALLSVCFSFCVDSSSQWRKICLVCKLFHQCAAKVLLHASVKTLPDLYHVCNSLQHLRVLRLPNFEKLSKQSASSFSYSSSLSLEPLSQLTNLHKLDASYTGFPVNQLHWLLPLTSLRKIGFSDSNLMRDEHLLSIVKHFPFLKTLRLSYCNHFTTKGYATVCTLTCLRRLDVSGNKGLTDENVNSFSALTSLVVLDIAENDQLTDNAMKNLSTLVNLKELCLGSNDAITDDGLQSVSCMTSLKRIYLDGVVEVTGKGLKWLSELPCLRIVNVYFDDLITDEGLSVLASISSLQYLQLSNDRLKGSTFHLFTQIKSLYIHNCPRVTPKGISAMAKALPNLSELKLSGMMKQIDDQVVESLAPLINLQELHLNVWHKVTDRSVKMLCKHLTKLHTLDLEACGELTVGLFEGVNHLALKHLSVSFGQNDFRSWSMLRSSTETKKDQGPMSTSLLLDPASHAFTVLPKTLTFLRLGGDNNKNAVTVSALAALPQLKFLRFGMDPQIELANFMNKTLVPLRKQASIYDKIREHAYDYNLVQPQPSSMRGKFRASAMTSSNPASTHRNETAASSPVVGTSVLKRNIQKDVSTTLASSVPISTTNVSANTPSIHSQITSTQATSKTSFHRPLVVDGSKPLISDSVSQVCIHADPSNMEDTSSPNLTKGARRQRNKKVNLVSQWATESKKPR